MIAAWLVSTCPASVKATSEWSFPEWKSYCEDKGYHECIAAIESEMIRRQESLVHREPGVLSFQIPSGGEFALRDTKDGRYRGARYNYWGTSGEFHLIRIQLYEAVWLGLLHAETGRLTKVIRGGFPVISPDRSRMVSGSMGAVERSAIVDVWDADTDGFVRAFDTRVRAPTIGIPLFRWASNDKIEVCWKSCDEVFELGQLAFDGEEWHLEATGEGD